MPFTAEKVDQTYFANIKAHSTLLFLYSKMKVKRRDLYLFQVSFR